MLFFVTQTGPLLGCGVESSGVTRPVSHAGFTGLKLQLPLAITAAVEPPALVLEVVTLFLDQDKLP